VFSNAHSFVADVQHDPAQHTRDQMLRLSSNEKMDLKHSTDDGLYLGVRTCAAIDHTFIARDTFVLYHEKTTEHAPLDLIIAYRPLQGRKLQ
jgi:hypothetical protein